MLIKMPDLVYHSQMPDFKRVIFSETALVQFKKWILGDIKSCYKL